MRKDPVLVLFIISISLISIIVCTSCYHRVKYDMIYKLPKMNNEQPSKIIKDK